MIGTLLLFGGGSAARPARDHPGDRDRWPGARCSSRCSCRRSWCFGTAADLALDAHASTSARSSATSCRPSSAAASSRSARYIDTLLASLLPTGAVTALMNAQILYTLPVSLFGIVDLGSRTARDVRRRRRPAPAAARGAPRADRRRRSSALRSSWCRRRSAFLALRRRDRRRDPAARPIPPRRTAVMSGASWRIVGRAAGVDDGAAVLGGVLRDRRHADAAALRRRSGVVLVDRARLSVRARGAAASRDQPAVGRRRA